MGSLEPRPADASTSPLLPWALGAQLLLWLAFAALCASGAPPAVDLGAHAAELEVLKHLLRGEPDVSAVYSVHFTPGYGLTTWLFLPLAFLFDGAVATRAAWFVALALFPLAVAALLHALKRPVWPAMFALPLAFNVSYWYGLLPGLFAQPLTLFTAAAAVRALETRSSKWWLAVNLLAASVMLSNLFTFVALCVALAALFVHARGVRGAVPALFGALLGPVVMSLPMLVPLLSRSASDGPWPQTTYDLPAHFNWFWKTLGPEGAWTLAAPLLTGAAFLGFGVVRRKDGAAGLTMALALLVLYLATPKTLGGIFLVCTRLPSLVGLFALAAVDGRALPSWLRVGLGVITIAALGQVALFHTRFAELTQGLDEITRAAPPSRHGYLSLEGDRALGSKHIYLVHLGQWWTARHGGVGHDFFADSDHHQVRFNPGVTVPSQLAPDQPEAFAQFDALLVFGGGELPAGLEDFEQTEREGLWRKLVRRPAQR